MSFRTAKVTPISFDEFSRMLARCRPPQGWSNSIGVSNSGGPDSTCLLFLLTRHIRESGHAGHRSQKIYSLTVDHDLQESSASMADHCARTARSLGVEHVLRKITWGEHPYPERPLHGRKFEQIARVSRYHALFKSMTILGTRTLATGHHADDQVETSLMRLSKGSTELGAGGMRPCRRWGMGMNSSTGAVDLRWFGHEGMAKWIVRPLLGISKDRILATCDANNLEFVTDSTNFQPGLTFRNAIRDALSKRDSNSSTIPSAPLPCDIATEMRNIEKTIQSLSVFPAHVPPGKNSLREAVDRLTKQVEEIDRQVDIHLNLVRLPSHPGSCVLSSSGLSSITNDLVRRSLVLRVMRFISFYPWGSLHADGKRKQTSIDQIIEKIWLPNPFKSNISGFCAGGGVIWTPVVIKRNHIKIPNPETYLKIQAEDTAWQVTRQPPLSLQNRNLPDPLHITLTGTIHNALMAWKEGIGPAMVEMLYDCRFLLHFDVSKMPGDIVSSIERREHGFDLFVAPVTRRYCPVVATQRGTVNTVIHSKIDMQHEPERKLWIQARDEVVAEWIGVEWIRPLDAL